MFFISSCSSWQVRVVESEVGSEELVYDLELALIIDLLHVAANQGFVLNRDSRLLLSRCTPVG